MGSVIMAYPAERILPIWRGLRTALGENAIAITADSASIPTSHKRDAEEFARECGFRHEYIETYEFENPDYVKNDQNRCFHCKDELFNQLEAFAQSRGFRAYRLWRKQRRFGRLPSWPARCKNSRSESAVGGCRFDEIGNSRIVQAGGAYRHGTVRRLLVLSSRVPYGTPVTPETIRTIEQGEEAIRALGFRQFRVRFHGDLVRLEIAKEEMPKAMTAENARAFSAIFKQLGFLYVTLDLEGYRQGSLNAALGQPLIRTSRCRSSSGHLLDTVNRHGRRERVARRACREWPCWYRSIPASNDRSNKKAARREPGRRE